MYASMFLTEDKAEKAQHIGLKAGKPKARMPGLLSKKEVVHGGMKAEPGSRHVFAHTYAEYFDSSIYIVCVPVSSFDALEGRATLENCGASCLCREHAFAVHLAVKGRCRSEVAFSLWEYVAEVLVRISQKQVDHSDKGTTYDNIGLHS